MKAIETLYNGIQFRSRLEARWAAFWDELGWKWTYEPFTGEHYIPDFLIHGDRPFLVEVRPVVRIQEYEAQIVTMRINPDEWQHDLFVAGTDPLPMFEPFSWLGYNSAGLLGEHFGDVDDEAPTDRAWEIGVWTTCLRCRQVAVFSDVQSYACRPCGHYDGNSYIGGNPKDRIAVAWKEAINRTRWTP